VAVAAPGLKVGSMLLVILGMNLLAKTIFVVPNARAGAVIIQVPTVPAGLLKSTTLKSLNFEVAVTLLW